MSSANVILIAWLIGDILASLAIFAACGYVVFVMGHSVWWFIPAFILACSFGGSKLYKRLNEQAGAKGDSTEDKS